jgi:hypothetical protein
VTSITNLGGSEHYFDSTIGEPRRSAFKVSGSRP